MESKIDHYQKKYEKQVEEDKAKGDRLYGKPIWKKFKNREEYAKTAVYDWNETETWFLQRYQPSKKIAKTVLMCDIITSWSARNKLSFCIFFNEMSELCLDLILKKKRRYGRIKNMEKDVEILSTKTDLESAKLFVSNLKVESEKLTIQYEKQKKKNENKKLKENRVHNLKIKGALVAIRNILDERKQTYRIFEEARNIAIHLKMKKKGVTTIKIPKKEVHKKLEVLPELIESLVKAHEHGITCKYFLYHEI